MATQTRVDPERIATLCGRLGVEFNYQFDELISRLESAYATSLDLDEDDPFLMACNVCGFQAPDVDQVLECPGCGTIFEEPKEVVMETAMTRREQTAIEPSESKATIKQQQKLVTIEKTIDDALAEGGRIEWQIGKALRDIWSTDIWKAVGDHKTFGDYVKARFDLPLRTAQRYIAIAESFTAEDSGRFTIRHLDLLGSIKNPEDRKRFILEAKTEAPTYKALADKVKLYRAENGLQSKRDQADEERYRLAVTLPFGVVVEGQWKAGRGKKRIASFKLGEGSFILEDLGDDGFVLRLAKPRADSKS